MTTELRTLTTSRQQRVLLRLLSCAYTVPHWVLTSELMGHHCVAEGLSAPESVRLTEDVIASGVVFFRVVTTQAAGGQVTATHVPLGAAEATGEVRAHVETEELRARAREVH